MKVLILGGGIGGMAAAMEFARLGDDVHLVEIDKDWKAIGTGLTLSVLTLRALCDLGLASQIATHGFVHDGVDIYDQKGNFIRSVLSKRTIAPDFPSEGAILRPVLHRILCARVEELGIPVRLGDTVEDIEVRSSDCSVHFRSGIEETYDLVVGADGVNSRLRQLVMPDAPKPAYTGQACWRILFDRPADMTRGRMFQSENMKVGFNPCSPSQMYMYLMEPVPMSTRRDERELPHIARGLLAEFHEVIGDFSEKIGSETPIIYRPLESVLLDGPWHRGALVLIGDAAHATTPHLGSGAGLAVEDAIVLPREIHAAGCDLGTAFDRFMALRGERARFVVETSRRIGEMEITGASMSARSRLLAEGFDRIAEPYLN